EGEGEGEIDGEVEVEPEVEVEIEIEGEVEVEVEVEVEIVLTLSCPTLSLARTFPTVSPTASPVAPHANPATNTQLIQRLPIVSSAFGTDTLHGRGHPRFRRNSTARAPNGVGDGTRPDGGAHTGGTCRIGSIDGRGRAEPHGLASALEV